MIVACIPAFNEETNLPGVIKGLKGHVNKVIVCDDGSKDGTARVARRAGAMVVVPKKLKRFVNRAYGQVMHAMKIAWSFRGGGQMGKLQGLLLEEQLELCSVPWRGNDEGARGLGAARARTC